MRKSIKGPGWDINSVIVRNAGDIDVRSVPVVFCLDCHMVKVMLVNKRVAPRFLPLFPQPFLIIFELSSLSFAFGSHSQPSSLTSQLRKHPPYASPPPPPPKQPLLQHHHHHYFKTHSFSYYQKRFFSSIPRNHLFSSRHFCPMVVYKADGFFFSFVGVCM